jgi:hypothetical protein
MTIASSGRTAAVLLCAMLATSAAQAVYRCGNVFQDRPCDGAGAQTQVAPANRPATLPAAAAPAPSSSPFAAACARVGQEAQKMVWKREAGATQERQLAELPNNGTRDEMAKVIDSVYRKRGTAPDIRAAVEAECLVEKQQAADAAAALKALQQQAGASTPAVASPPAPATSTAVQKISGEAPPNYACPAWRSELEAVNADFRRGGSAATMERLQERRRKVEKHLREARC